MATNFGQFQRVELGFGLDNYNDPIGFSGKDAWVRQIAHLCIMDPGTIPSNPSIGIGIKRYDFLLEGDRRKLENAINQQVPKFYPDMPFVECKTLVNDSDKAQDILYLLIKLNNTVEDNTVVVAIKRGYNYIDFAIAM